MSALFLICLGGSLLILKYFNDERNLITAEVQQKYQPRLQIISQSLENKKISSSGLKIAKTDSTFDSLKKEEEEKVREAIKTFTDHSENIKKAWEVYRVEMYRNAGLIDQDIADLDQMNNQFSKLLEEIQTEITHANPSPDRVAALQKMHQETMKQMDQSVAEFLGEVRFDYATGARAAFNRSFQELTHSNTEFLGW